MTQPAQIVYNDPGNYDTWLNYTDHTFVVACHIEHKGGPATKAHPAGGPRTKYYRFEPSKDGKPSETMVEREYRHVIQTYLCSEQECLSSPGSKLCWKDHPAQVVGGKCPQLVRKNAPHIRLNPVFSDDFIEQRRVDGTGKVTFELEEKRKEQAAQNAAMARASTKKASE